MYLERLAISRRTLIIFSELAVVLGMFFFIICSLPNSFIELSGSSVCDISTRKIDSRVAEVERMAKGVKTYQLDLSSCLNAKNNLLVIKTLQYDEVKFYEQYQLTTYQRIILDKFEKINSRFPVFKVPENLTTISISISETTVDSISFSLVDTNEFQRLNQNAVLFYAIIFSAFSTIIIFNILIYFRSGDSDYAAYIPFLLSNYAFLFFSEGIYQYFQIQWLEESRSHITWFLASSTVYLANRFVIRFTKLDSYYPNMTRWALQFPAYLCLTFGLLSTLGLSAAIPLIQITSLWLAIVTLPILIPLLNRSSFSIEYVVVAWSIILFAIIARIAYGFGFIGLSGLVIYGVLIASLFESLLLSLAIGNKIVHLKAKEIKLYEEAITDELTKVYNLRGLKEKANHIITQEKLNRIPTQIAILDIDYFKQVNDKFGHQAGDEVLKALSKRIKNTLRSDDIFGRHGGEEFLIIMPETSAKQLNQIMHRVIRKIRGQAFSFNNSKINVTISIGATQVRTTDKNLDDCIERADKALYSAKNNGRNQLASI